MEFRCRLGTAGGQIVEGVYVAAERGRPAPRARGQGPARPVARPARRPCRGLALRRRTIKRHEFLIFNQELATLLKAGMPLVQSLDILRQRLTNPVFKAVLDDVHEKVRGGTALSDAFGAHADLFSGVYTASLVAGERSGSLDTVLRRFVAYSKVIDAVRRKTISALLYPVILVALAVVLVAIIVVKVVPAFSGFYASFDQELPLVTRIIVARLERRARTTCWICGPALVVAAVGFMALGPPARAAGPLRPPAAAAARCSGRSPASSPPRRSPAPWPRWSAAAFRWSTPSTPPPPRPSNRYLGDELRTVAVRVREGRGFAATLLERQVVPDVAIKMIEVGESTGSLQEMLTSLADFYDEDVETEVGRFVTLIEPVLLVFMGVVIAGVVLALYLPLFQLVVGDGPLRPEPTWTPRPTDAFDPQALADERLRAAADRRRPRRGGARPPPGRPLPARVPRHGAVPDRSGAVPRHPRRPDAALRLRAVPPRRPGAGHRRLRSDRPADDRRAGGAARHAGAGHGRRPHRHRVDPQEERELAARARRRHRGLPDPGPQGRGLERETSPSSG